MASEKRLILYALVLYSGIILGKIFSLFLEWDKPTQKHERLLSVNKISVKYKKSMSMKIFNYS